MERSEVSQTAGLFSGRPPVEAVKALLSVFACRRCPLPPCARAPPVVELPDEEKATDDDGLGCVGLLVNSTCGAVGASARWWAHSAELLVKACFVQGLSSPLLSVCVERCWRLLG